MMQTNKFAYSRIAVVVLTFSAAAFGGLALREGYTDTAVIPVKGDVPTLGIGTTEGVRMGDRITPPQAIARALKDVQKYEGALKNCVTVPLHQHEYDAWVSFAYNVGGGAFCRSTAVKKLNTGDYAGACDELLKWVFVGSMRVRGLEIRRESERQQCLGNK